MSEDDDGCGQVILDGEAGCGCRDHDCPGRSERLKRGVKPIHSPTHCMAWSGLIAAPNFVKVHYLPS